MKRKHLDTLIKGLHTQAPSSLDDRVHPLLNKVESSQESQAKSCLWRNIMQHSLTRYATATVVVMIIAITIFKLNGSMTTPAYGITDAYRMDQQVETIHMKGLCIFNPKYANQGPIVSPVEYWYDFTNGRARLTKNVFVGGLNPHVGQDESVNDGQYTMNINHTEKSVAFTINADSDFHRELFIRRNYLSMLQRIYSDADQIDTFDQVGVEKIDGDLYDIWERSGNQEKIRLWLSPASGHIARCTRWSGKRENDWTLRYEIDLIERNLDIPDSVFDTSVPAGYHASSSKELAKTSSFIPIIGGGSGGLTVYIMFTLSDGSVIIGWNSIHPEDARTQTALFQDLTPGGPLPELGIVVTALDGIGLGSSPMISYTGHHLTTTQKDGKFIEWGVYISGQETSSLGIRGYQLINRYNINTVQVNLNSGPGLSIENEYDFETLVMGAMAELNDSGYAPNEVSYQDLMSLIQKIKEGNKRDIP